MKESKSKGITLIALIITIIVMLILVTVSIQVALNTGLFESAGKATKDWKESQDKEQELAGGQVTIGDKTYASIDDYLEGIEKIEEIHNWTRSGDTITCAHCSTTLSIGEQLNYTKTGAASTTISEEKSGIAQAKLDGKSWASSYGDQTINKDETTSWLVLGIQDQNNNGINETLLLTTATPTTGTVRMYGIPAYDYAIEEINRMCKELYGSEARGMTIEDVNNCLEYTPVGGMYYDGSAYQTTGNFTTTLSGLGDTWTNIQNYNINNKDGVFYTPEYPEGTTDADELGKYILDGYYYYVSNDGTYLVENFDEEDTSNTITTATRDLIFGSSGNYYYWLASRGVDADSVFAGFGPGVVYGGLAGSFNGTFRSVGVSFNFTLSVRAVISLTSEIPASLGIPEVDTEEETWRI